MAFAHRLAKLTDTTVNALRLRGKIGSSGDISFAGHEYAVARGNDGLSVANEEQFADYRRLFLFTELSDAAPEVRTALDRGENSIVVGGRSLAVRKCIRAEVSNISNSSELCVRWNVRNKQKCSGPFVHGSICPQRKVAAIGAYLASSPKNGRLHATAVYQELIDHEHMWQNCCILVAAPPMAFKALLSGDDRGGSENGPATTIRLVMQAYASSFKDDDTNDRAFVFAAQLEATLSSFNDIVKHCSLNFGDAHIVVQALHYGIDTCVMDADVHDTMTVLEQFQSALKDILLPKTAVCLRLVRM